MGILRAWILGGPALLVNDEGHSVLHRPEQTDWKLSALFLDRDIHMV